MLGWSATTTAKKAAKPKQPGMGGGVGGSARRLFSCRADGIHAVFFYTRSLENLWRMSLWKNIKLKWKKGNHMRCQVKTAYGDTWQQFVLCAGIKLQRNGGCTTGGMGHSKAQQGEKG